MPPISSSPSDPPTTRSPVPPAGGPIVLASASPRRRDLLTRAGVQFEVIPADIDEESAPGEGPRDLVLRLARDKALAVAARLPAEAPDRVLGSDTIVVRDGEVLGKPRDADHAFELLSSLLGRRHQVLTGVAIVERASGRVRTVAVESFVTMRTAEASEVREYVATGEPLDKAGAYAVQGQGRRFVSRVEGSETNVIGLPLDETLALLGDSA